MVPHSACYFDYDDLQYKDAWLGFGSSEHRNPATRTGKVTPDSEAHRINHGITFDIGDTVMSKAANKATKQYTRGRYIVTIRDCVGGYGNFDLPGTPAFLDTAVHEGVHIFVARYVPQFIDAGHLPIIGGPVNLVHETIAYALGRIATGRLHALPFAPAQAFWGLSGLNRIEILFAAYLGYRFW